MERATWALERGDEPLLATAIHNGHEVRPELAEMMILPEPDRLREEDPYTGTWAAVAANSIILKVSRFEVDLNRPREKAVYARPEDCWGLKVWNGVPSDELIAGSLSIYDRFYDTLGSILSELEAKHGRFVVFDVHSYNHRRHGPDVEPEDPELNPQVNLGTGSMDRSRWAPVVDGFMDELRSFPYMGGALDVRENIKFKGGHLSTWVHENFPDSGCCLAIEFQKFFMDEWTGEVFPDHMNAILRAMVKVRGRVLTELAKLPS